MEELRRTLRKFGYSEQQVNRRLHVMNAAFEDANVIGYEDLIAVMKNHEKDRHVLAAAVRTGARAIVTDNVRDFPPAAIEQYNLVVTSADDFLCQQFHLESGITLDGLERQAADIHQSFGALLGKLNASAPTFVNLVRQQVSP